LHEPRGKSRVSLENRDVNEWTNPSLYVIFFLWHRQHQHFRVMPFGVSILKVVIRGA
jgi:hypothetical protein